MFLEIRGLKKSFGEGENRTEVLKVMDVALKNME